MIVGADAHIGPFGSYEFAADYRKIGAFCRADVGIGPYRAQYGFAAAHRAEQSPAPTNAFAKLTVSCAAGRLSGGFVRS